MASPHISAQSSVRPARVADAPAISALIQPFADQDLMLPRPVAQIYETIRDFQVLYDGEALLGCVALHVWDDGLGELKSLAVSPTAQGTGLGGRLVEQVVAEARALGLGRVFALVLRPTFFGRHGFRAVVRDELPQKVWGECIWCPKFHRCDEIAMVRDVGDQLAG